MTTQRHIILLLAILLVSSCADKKTKTTNTKLEVHNFDFSSIRNKFKYSDLTTFSIDTIAWDKRKEFYTKLDSIEYFQIYQDTTLNEYLGQYSENIDLDFFYSKQKSKRGLLEFTILTQREGEYCDRILYNIYDLKGKLISSFIVASGCGDGGYYETSKGKFLNDSTYVLFSEDNYDTKDVEKLNTITYSKTTTSIKTSGKIVQKEALVKTKIE